MSETEIQHPNTMEVTCRQAPAMGVKTSRWKFQEKQDICIISPYLPRDTLAYTGERKSALDFTVNSTLTKWLGGALTRGLNLGSPHHRRWKTTPQGTHPELCPRSEMQLHWTTAVPMLHILAKATFTLRRKAEWLQRQPQSLRSRKYLLSGPWQKKLRDSCYKK